MSSRRNAFILACGTALGATGCGTAPTYQGSAMSDLTAGIRNAVSGAATGIQNAVTPSAASNNPYRTINPTLLALLNEDTQVRISKLRPEDARVVRVPDYSQKCASSVAYYADGNKGPGPLGNRNNVGGATGVGTGIIQGVWNSATGGRAGAGAQGANEFGNATLMNASAFDKQWAELCNKVGELSLQGYQKADPYGQGTAQWKAEWRPIAAQTPRLAHLAVNAEIGLSAMSNDAKNRAITTWGSGAASRVLPQYQNGPGGVAGGLIRRALD